MIFVGGFINGLKYILSNRAEHLTNKRSSSNLLGVISAQLMFKSFLSASHTVSKLDVHHHGGGVLGGDALQGHVIAGLGRLLLQTVGQAH